MAVFLVCVSCNTNIFKKAILANLLSNSVFVVKGFGHDAFMTQPAPAMAEQGGKYNQRNQQIKLAVSIKKRNQAQQARFDQDADATYFE